MLETIKIIQIKKITIKNTFWYYRISIVAQTQIIIQQIGVILIKGNFHEIRIIGLPEYSKENKVWSTAVLKDQNMKNKRLSWSWVSAERSRGLVRGRVWQ